MKKIIFIISVSLSVIFYSCKSNAKIEKENTHKINDETRNKNVYEIELKNSIEIHIPYHSEEEIL